MKRANNWRLVLSAAVGLLLSAGIARADDDKPRAEGDDHRHEQWDEGDRAHPPRGDGARRGEDRGPEHRGPGADRGPEGRGFEGRRPGFGPPQGGFGPRPEGIDARLNRLERKLDQVLRELHALREGEGRPSGRGDRPGPPRRDSERSGDDRRDDRPGF